MNNYPHGIIKPALSFWLEEAQQCTHNDDLLGMNYKYKTIVIKENDTTCKTYVFIFIYSNTLHAVSICSFG